MLRVSVSAALVLALAACGQKEEPAAPATSPAATPAPATPAPTTDATPAATPAPDATPAPAAAADAKPATPAASTGKATDDAAWAKYVPWKSTNPGVKKTGSGLEYVVLGSGPASGKSPTASQQAEVWYEGRLNSGGPAFDSAYQRNETATFPVGAVVPGFSEALQKMKPGDHWLIYLPANLAYGPQSPTPAIPPNSALVFELELASVVGFN